MGTTKDMKTLLGINFETEVDTLYFRALRNTKPLEFYGEFSCYSGDIGNQTE